MPALPRCNGVERGVREARSFSASEPILDPRSRFRIQLGGGFQHAGRRIEAGDVASFQRELTSKRARTGPQVEHTLSRQPDTMPCKAIKSLRREPRPVTRVVADCATEVRFGSQS